MSEDRLLYSLQINHEWYGDTPPPFEITPSTETAAAMHHSGLLFRQVAGGCEIYGTDVVADSAPDYLFEFQVVSNDPMILVYTDIGDSTVYDSLVYANIDISASDSEINVTPAHWQTVARPRNTLAILQIAIPNNTRPFSTLVKFPSVSVYWTYVIDAPWLPDYLEIIGPDGGVQFKETEASDVRLIKNARSFRSLKPRKLKRNEDSGYSLRLADSLADSPLTPLPAPAEYAVPRSISQSGAFEIPIYITVLARGS